MQKDYKYQQVINTYDNVGLSYKKDGNDYVADANGTFINRDGTWVNMSGQKFYILDENNEYTIYKKTDDPSIRLDNTTALNRAEKFILVKNYIDVNFVGERISITSKVANLYRKAVDDDGYHAVVSGEFYDFYKLLYYLRHCILDLPEYVNAIKTTKQWEEFELALKTSNIGKRTVRVWN